MLVFLAHPGPPVYGQEPPGRIASPFVPAGHWSIDAVRRLEGLGAAPRGFDPGMRSLRIAEAVWVFEAAAAADDAGIERLARAYLERIEEEFGSWVAMVDWTQSQLSSPSPAASDNADGSDDGQNPARPGPMIATGSIGAGYVRDQGKLLAGIGYDPADWQAPVPAVRVASGRADVFITVGLPRFLAAGATPLIRGDRTELGETHAVVQLGKIGLWGGRRAFGYGVAAGGGVVLSDRVMLDGAGIFLTEPVRLPGFLRGLGSIRAEMMVSQLDNGDVITEPWLWVSRVSLQPHPRLVLGLNRGAIFGGKGNSPVTFGNLLRTFAGVHAGDDRGEFANQVVSLDVRYRPPTGIPLVVWLEWGMEDSAGGWHRSPAILTGIELAGVPGVEALSIGLEHASFAAQSHKNPMWYRNLWMRGGWTHERRPLGHPLAGHGTEWRAYGSVDAFAARLRVRGDIRLRDRGEENLYAPARTGTSTAAELRGEWRAARWLDLALTGEVERAADWRASSWSANARVLF